MYSILTARSMKVVGLWLGLAAAAIAQTPSVAPLQTTAPLAGTGLPGSPFACPGCATGSSSQTGLVSGGGTVWTGNLTFTVGAATYFIGGVRYTSPLTQLTASAADPSNPRIDVIALNTSGAAVIVAGTPSATPVAPVLDPGTQLIPPLTFYTVAANATVPSNVSTTLIYDENVGAAAEWNSTVSGAGFNAGSTNNPYHLTKDIEATNVVAGNNVQLAQGSGSQNLSTFNTLSFFIRSKGALPAKSLINVYFASSGTQVGNSIALNQGSFGLDFTQTASYQMVVIPVSQFGTGTTTVNQLVFKIAGNGTNVGFYLDWINLQSGLSGPLAGTQMNWRGAWSSSTAYNQYDVVTNAGSTWVALAANTNVAPVAGTTWALIPVADANISVTDITTNNVSTTAHGFAPKAPNDATKFLNGTGAYTVPTGGALTQIGQVTTAALQTSVDFSSIPATYTNLVVTWVARDNSTSGVILLKLNADATQGDYQGTPWTLNAAGTITSGVFSVSPAQGFQVGNIAASGAGANYFGTGELRINGYAQTNNNKNFIAKLYYAAGATNVQGLDTWSSWNSTAAINELTFTLGAGDAFVNGSVFTLYGEK